MFVYEDYGDMGGEMVEWGGGDGFWGGFDGWEGWVGGWGGDVVLYFWVGKVGLLKGSDVSLKFKNI